MAGMLLALTGCSTTLRPPAATYTRPETRVAPATANPRAVLVDTARSMLGQPYRFGGATPGGFDCSGLVVYAADNAGIQMPRTAHEQLRTGVPIPREAIEAGDLVFLHLRHKELHVGIAIDGTRFVHAPSTGRSVRIDSLEAPPYAHAFLQARRIVVDPAPPAALGSGLQSPSSRTED
jgi:cell wall-associated NlpC family hydrolase